MRRPANRATLRICLRLLPLAVVSLLILLLATTEPTGAVDEQAVAEHKLDEQRAGKTRFVTKSLRGRVVWLASALSERHGLVIVPAARERVLALKTAHGHLHPIIEDERGRSFRRDKRLREMDVELLVRQYEGLPMVQVIRTHAVDDQGKYELDYWCEICAISMVELKVCDCCQGPTELRRRKVEAKKAQRP